MLRGGGRVHFIFTKLNFANLTGIVMCDLPKLLMEGVFCLCQQIS